MAARAIFVNLFLRAWLYGLIYVGVGTLVPKHRIYGAPPPPKVPYCYKQVKQCTGRQSVYTKGTTPISLNQKYFGVVLDKNLILSQQVI